MNLIKLNIFPGFENLCHSYYYDGDSGAIMTKHDSGILLSEFRCPGSDETLDLFTRDCKIFQVRYCEIEETYQKHKVPLQLGFIQVARILPHIHEEFYFHPTDKVIIQWKNNGEPFSFVQWNEQHEDRCFLLRVAKNSAEDNISFNFLNDEYQKWQSALDKTNTDAKASD